KGRFLRLDRQVFILPAHHEPFATQAMSRTMPRMSGVPAPLAVPGSSRVQLPVSRYLVCRYVAGVAFRHCPARSAICATAAASASIARQIIGACTGMPCRIVRLAAVLDDMSGNLLIAWLRGLGKGAE